MTVIGKVDPAAIKEKLEQKTKKKVELVSPQPKKDGGGDKKAEEKPAEKKPEEKKPAEDKKPKQVKLKVFFFNNYFIILYSYLLVVIR